MQLEVEKECYKKREAVDAGDGMIAHNFSLRIRKTSVSIGQWRMVEKKNKKILINSYYGVRFDVKGNPIKNIGNPQKGRLLGTTFSGRRS